LKQAETCADKPLPGKKGELAKMILKKPAGIRASICPDVPRVAQSVSFGKVWLTLATKASYIQQSCDDKTKGKKSIMYTTAKNHHEVAQHIFLEIQKKAMTATEVTKLRSRLVAQDVALPASEQAEKADDVLNSGRHDAECSSGSDSDDTSHDSLMSDDSCND
jgi:hypothetical protein